MFLRNQNNLQETKLVGRQRKNRIHSLPALSLCKRHVDMEKSRSK